MLGIPAVGVPAGRAPRPLVLALRWGRTYRVSVFDLGLACCSAEFVAAALRRPDLAAAPAPPPASQRQAELMVVSGTCTDAMAPAVRALYERLPEPKYVMAYGACASTGGPYWDSYSVTKGVDQIIPVDRYVPGCPPRPEALLQAVAELAGELAGTPLPGGPGS